MYLCSTASTTGSPAGWSEELSDLCEMSSLVPHLVALGLNISLSQCEIPGEIPDPWDQYFSSLLASRKGTESLE